MNKVDDTNKKDSNLNDNNDDGDGGNHKFNKKGDDKEVDDDYEVREEGIKKEEMDDSTLNGNNKNRKSKKRLTVVDEILLTKTKNFNEMLRKRGVIYIARIPPRMTPSKMKVLLSDFGEITRVYLVEEDTTLRKQRNKEKGKKNVRGRKRYIEGWVEFAKKRIAKDVAASLNNQRISNRKGNVHYDDLWNIRYLSKFKWSHLTEKVAYERRVREQKLRIEMMQARKDNVNYTNLIETGKMLDHIEERKKRREAKQNGGGIDDAIESNKEMHRKKRRRERQTKPIKDGMDKATKNALLASLL